MIRASSDRDVKHLAELARRLERPAPLPRSYDDLDGSEDQTSIKLIETMFRAGKPVALVCHAPSALCHAKTLDGKPLVQGKRVTGFTDRTAA